MTKKDLELIAAAETAYWMDINPDAAETEEARNKLEELRTYGYHMEEAIYDMI